MKIPLPLLAALALCFCSAPTASSHPHVFVDCAPTLVFDDEGLEIQHSLEKVERFGYCCDQIVPLGVSVRFRDKASAEGSGGAKAESSVSFPQRFLSRINAWQKEIKSRLTRFARDIRKNPYGKPLGLFLLLSFVYGVLHALGPGHGKSIVCSYFLSRPGKALHGTLMANLITFVHVGSAVTTVLIFYFLFKARGMTSFENASVVLQKASYALLALLGLALAAHKIHELKAMKGKRFGECGSQEARYKSLVAVALATGLVPCPGAAIILIFSITLKILVPGLLAMVCIAVGMGLTTSLFALAAIKSRDALFRWTSRGERLFSISYAVVSLGGALIITIMGVALFLQT